MTSRERLPDGNFQTCGEKSAPKTNNLLLALDWLDGTSGLAELRHAKPLPVRIT